MANQWYRIVATMTGATAGAVWVNGTPQSLTASGMGGSTASYAGGTGTWVGRYRASTDLYANGVVADPSVWSLAFTDSDAAADYDLSRRNYPGVLNRLPIESVNTALINQSLQYAYPLTGRNVNTSMNGCYPITGR
jgi:hypothetical protein